MIMALSFRFSDPAAVKVNDGRMRTMPAPTGVEPRPEMRIGFVLSRAPPAPLTLKVATTVVVKSPEPLRVPPAQLNWELKVMLPAPPRLPVGCNVAIVAVEVDATLSDPVIFSVSAQLSELML